jgi:hypothetical protein
LRGALLFRERSPTATPGTSRGNIAAALLVAGDVIQDIRVVCGAVECVPRRLTGVEELARGSAKNEETANLAASVAARRVPLNYNGFKIPLMENLVRRAARAWNSWSCCATAGMPGDRSARGVSFGLFWWFAGAALALIVAHLVYSWRRPPQA